MRLTTFLIGIQACFATVLLADKLNAQTISLDLQRANISQIFLVIEKQANVTFIYDKKELQGLDAVTLKATKQTLAEVLKEISDKLPLHFKQSGNVIGVSRISDNGVPAKIPLAAPPQKITGKVLDEDNQPLPGATVKIKGTTIAATTNTEGKFTLDNVPVGSSLVITFIGYEESEVNATDDLTITLIKSSSKLDEVQVIAYGTTTERLGTGNVTSLRSDVIEQQPITNPLQALEGRIAGVQVTQTNGLPGGAITVQIRGQNSIAASNNPLYVVDGVPFTSTAVERLGGVIGNGSTTNIVNGSPMNSIDPSDIESISILKDADATAIYGSRGANGVILITTKKGKAGKTTVGFNINTGAGSATGIEPTLGLEQYLAARHAALNNSSSAINSSTAPDLITWDTTRYTNWQKMYLGGIAKMTNATATVQGGNDLTTFLISGTYHDESTVQQTDAGYSRENVHLNIQHTSTDHRFSMTTNAFYVTDNNKLYGSTADLLTAARVPADYPEYNSNGTFFWGASKSNPAALLSKYYKSQTDNLNADMTLRYTILPGLDIKTNLGYNKIDNSQIIPTPIAAQDPSTAPTGSTSFADQNIKTYIFEPQITYSLNVGKGKLNLLAGATLQHNITTGQQFNVTGYTSDLLLESLNFGTLSSKSASTVDYKYMSMFGRATYNWQDKYIVNGSVRRDGSSRFGPGNQFGTFGSIGSAWLFTNEDLIKQQLNWLSYGKLRGSWGTTGNDGIGDYGYLSIYQSAAQYGSTNTIVPSQIANADYKWEVNKKLEFALEAGVFKDRILITTAWYSNRSDNELVGYPLPSITGFTSYQANLPAVVRNTGWEFELNTVNIHGRQLTWSSALNLTIPRNKLVSFPNIAATSYANTYVVGQPLSIVQGYQFLGVDPQTGLSKIRDVNNDGSFTQTSSYNAQGGDYVIIGKTAPDMYGGLSNTFKYKGVQLDFFLQYVKQQGFNLYRLYNSFGNTFNVWDAYSGYWKQPGDITSLPKPFTSSNPSSSQFASSSAIISDASFLRLKNISVSYTFSQTWSRKLNISMLRIYVQGENVLTFTPYKGYDPETQIAGPSVLTYPPVKMFTTGIQCTL